ncbi:MAG: NifU family protein [Bradymonadaceae bacterium]|nr:NifU family protein [Lujinxingiaceae bacterium]
MKIAEIEHTPNPNAMKFVLTEPITRGFVTRSFEGPDDAVDTPLASQIFEIEHVISVYFADRWITVTQDGGAPWPELMREIAVPIRAATLDDALAAIGSPSSGLVVEGFEDNPGLDDPRIPMIREVLEIHILPFLAGDGGGLQIVGLVDDQLMIRYEGACGTCPASMSGTLMAIENLIQVEVDPSILVVTV